LKEPLSLLKGFCFSISFAGSLYLLPKTMVLFKMKSTNYYYRYGNKLPTHFRLINEKKQTLFCEQIYPYESMKDATMVSYDDHELVLFASTSSDLVSQTIRKNKIWEQDITSNIIFALSYMNKKNGENVTFVDIGANIGWFSFYVTSSLLPFVHTYSFEAMPRNILFLRNSLCANERLQNSITINGYGLSNQERYCRIFSHERNTQNGVVHCNDIAPESNEMIYRGNVHLLPLDNVFNTPISVIKMDVEGFNFRLRTSHGVRSNSD